MEQLTYSSYLKYRIDKHNVYLKYDKLIKRFDLTNEILDDIIDHYNLDPFSKHSLDIDFIVQYLLHIKFDFPDYDIEIMDEDTVKIYLEDNYPDLKKPTEYFKNKDINIVWDLPSEDVVINFSKLNLDCDFYNGILYIYDINNLPEEDKEIVKKLNELINGH